MELAIGIAIPTLPVVAASGDMELTFATASLPVALHRGEHQAFYVAPSLSVVSFDDTTLRFDALGGNAVTYEIADETGAGLGLDYSRAVAKSSWAIQLQLDYLELGVDGVNPENPADRLELDPDPYSIAFGLAWRP